jgi:hypothetical protein
VDDLFLAIYITAAFKHLFGFAMRKSVIVFLDDLRYYSHATYPIAHSLATVLGLAPYRRMVRAMFVRRQTTIVEHTTDLNGTNIQMPRIAYRNQKK